MIWELDDEFQSMILKAKRSNFCDWTIIVTIQNLIITLFFSVNFGVARTAVLSLTAYDKYLSVHVHCIVWLLSVQFRGQNKVGAGASEDSRIMYFYLFLYILGVYK
jgi:hypothetical protein